MLRYASQNFAANGLSNQPALLWRLIDMLCRWQAVDNATTREGVSVVVVRWQTMDDTMRAGLPDESRHHQCRCIGGGQEIRHQCRSAGGGRRMAQ
jgi:hypothetical protein